jgi:hypothetical protein
MQTSSDDYGSSVSERRRFIRYCNAYGRAVEIAMRCNAFGRKNRTRTVASNGSSRPSLTLGVLGALYGSAGSSVTLRRRGAAARSWPGRPRQWPPPPHSRGLAGDRTSRTHGTVDRPPTPPCQTRREDGGEDDRDPDHLPCPDDALGRKDPLRAHSGGRQGQLRAKPGQVGPLVGEFGLGVRPVLLAHHHRPRPEALRAACQPSALPGLPRGA